MRILSRLVEQASESQTLAIAARARTLEQEGHDCISLAVGEPDFPTPECICQAAINAIAEGKTRYTDAAGIPELRARVAEKFRTENKLPFAHASNVLISCGAKHSIMNALRALCNPGDRVLIVAPYWVSYPAMVTLAGGIPTIIRTQPEHGFKLQPEQLAAHMRNDVACVILNSPCNPTGAVYTRAELESLANVLGSHDCYILSDEIYEKLIYSGSQHISIGSFESVAQRVITVNGCSKAYAMTGWRIGFMTGPDRLIAAAAKVQSQDTSNPTSIAQYAALAALDCAADAVESMREEFARRRDILLEHIRRLPTTTALAPDGAFYVWLDVRSLVERSGASSAELAEQLLERYYVAVVPGEAFGCQGYWRLSFATSTENLVRAVKRIGDFVHSLT